MKLRKLIYILALPLLLMGCMSIEDTYSEYAGDGKIRYVGKCYDIALASRWEALDVTWTNGIDPTIDKVLVTWSSPSVYGEMTLDKGTTYYKIPDIAYNETFEVKVYSVDAEGVLSLATTEYGTPYNDNHADVLSFAQVISRFYYFKDRLVLFFNSWDEGIINTELKYKDENGTIKTFEITSDLVAGDYMVLPDRIDPSYTVAVSRVGMIAGCEDLIPFDDYELEDTRLYTPDFRSYLLEKYGTEELEETVIDNVTEIDFDYDITSFQDLLNFENLTTFNLGKNRFMLDGLLDATYTTYASSVDDVALAQFVLGVIYDENNSFAVNRYNKHYFTDTEVASMPYVVDMGNPVITPLSYFDKSGWVVTSSVEDPIYDQYKEYLVDDNYLSSWQPTLSTSVRTYELTIDMGEVKSINGVDIVQHYFSEAATTDPSYMPSTVKVYISENIHTWSNATNIDENTLGMSSNEVTRINFSETKSARYIRLTVTDNLVNSFYGVALAEIDVF